MGETHGLLNLDVEPLQGSTSVLFLPRIPFGAIEVKPLRGFRNVINIL